MTKLPPLSVLLPPREPFTFHSTSSSTAMVDSYSSHACCAAPHQPQHYVPLPQHYAPQPQQFQAQPQQYQAQPPPYADHYSTPSQPKSAPSSPSSPTWWSASSSSRSFSQQQQPSEFPAYATATYSSGPFWKNTRGLCDAPLHPTASAGSASPDAPRSSVASSARPPTAPAATIVRPKKSRYLREMDRRAIIKRLDNGEKQCALAKEFSVSRSSICNLFKHRDEVLSRAAHQSPFSKHPKKCKKQPLPPRRFA